MTVDFYKNTSDDRKVNKNIGETPILALSSVIFKEDSSIMHPVLICHYDDKILKCNYLHISTFSRYYYIDNITISSGQRLIIECREDVLMSNKTQLYKTTAFVERSEASHSNMMINDPMFLSKNDPIVDYVVLSKNTPFVREGDFVLAIAGH